MLTSIVLPLFRLLSIYHTFHTLIQYIQNPFLLFISITLTYKTLDITPSQIPFQVIFNPVKGINLGTFYRTIHPQNITLSIQDVFHTYIQKLIEFNENQDTPPYRPSHLQELKHRSEYSSSQILTRKSNDMIILIIGYNEISYK